MDSQDYHNLLSENAVLKCKLESKAEAVVILTRELEVCRSERDQFKLMAEQLRDRYNTLKKRVEGWVLAEKRKPLLLQEKKGPSLLSVYDVQGFKRKGEQNLAQLLCELKEKNKILNSEVTELQQKLTDAQGDIKLLREQIAQEHSESPETKITESLPPIQKQEIVKELETVKHKYSLLERDLQSVLDEKEELVVARDAYLHKVERLNKQLNKMLHGEQHVIDIDAVIMENRNLNLGEIYQSSVTLVQGLTESSTFHRKFAALQLQLHIHSAASSAHQKYLQERVKQIQEEKAMVTATLSKYKNILEKKRSRGNIRLTGSGGNLVITNKQVQQLLQSNSFHQMPETPNAVAELQSLIVALYEALSDKSLALTHQKKANKLLGNRLTELEKKLKTMEESASRNNCERLPSVSLSLSELTEDSSIPCLNNAELAQSNRDECFTGIQAEYADHVSHDPSYLSTDSYNDLKVEPGGNEDASHHGDLDLLPTKEKQENQSRQLASLGQQNDLHLSERDQMYKNSCCNLDASDEEEEVIDPIKDGVLDYCTDHVDYTESDNKEDELPPHLQQLLDKALKEMEGTSEEVLIESLTSTT